MVSLEEIKEIKEPKDLSQQILRGFGVKARKVVREKSYFICDTQQGLKMIRRSGDSPENIIFQHDIKEKLYAGGFARTDRFCLSSEGKPYYPWNGDIYVMTGFLPYKDTGFSDAEEFRNIVEAAAWMHRLGRLGDYGGKVFAPQSDCLEEYRKSAAQLTAIKKKIGRQACMSDFDVIFLKNYAYYSKRLKSSIQLLEKADPAAALSEALRDGKVCHHALKEETVLADAGDIYVTRFSCAMFDLQLHDLADIIRRYLRNMSGTGFGIFQILDIYDKINTVSGEDAKILSAMLKYPHHFLKTAGQYYSKKRTWTPGALISRLKTVVACEDAYDRAISVLEIR
ncbi:MAG: hypothetical protein FWF44_11430 [Defluviitaleaceae bacterium]|nr:hypothetical protein [Defluviitaleaceae bacterium]